MATQVQLRRGNTSQTNAFTGAVAEITVDTDKETVVVHDGSTAGGFPLARESALSANLAFTQAAFNLANTANIKIDSGYAFANTVNIKVDAAFSFSNTVNIKTDAAFSKANAANVLAQAAFDKANTANVTAEAGFGRANSANILAQAAFNQANTANVTAQAAFNKANNALANTGGSISGDLTITGNLTIVGQQVYANTQTVLIKDNIITLNAAIDQASAPSANAGLEIDRGSSANVYLLWNENSDVWQFTNDGTTYYTIADTTTLSSAFDKANTANVTAEAGFSKANAANVLAQAAFNQANTANATGEAAFSKANSANVLAQSAFDKANTDTTNISVTPGTYGNASAIPSITVAANGRISAITTESFTAASIGDALALSIALG